MDLSRRATGKVFQLGVLLWEDAIHSVNSHNWSYPTFFVTDCMVSALLWYDMATLNLYPFLSKIFLFTSAGLFIFLNFFLSQIDENVQREIINHRTLRHPNIVRFKELCSIPIPLCVCYLLFNIFFLWVFVFLREWGSVKLNVP